MLAALREVPMKTASTRVSPHWGRNVTRAVLPTVLVASLRPPSPLKARKTIRPRTWAGVILAVRVTGAPYGTRVRFAASRTRARTFTRLAALAAKDLESPQKTVVSVVFLDSVRQREKLAVTAELSGARTPLTSVVSRDWPGDRPNSVTVVSPATGYTDPYSRTRPP